MSINMNTLNELRPSARSEAAGYMAFDLLDLLKYSDNPSVDICDQSEAIRNDIDQALENLKNSGLEFDYEDAAEIAFALV